MYELEASVILRGLSSGDTVIVHEPYTKLAAALTEQSIPMGIKTAYTTYQTSRGPEDGLWATIHPQAPDLTLSSLLPKFISSFVNLSHDTEHGTLERFVRTRHPFHCRFENNSSIFATESRIPRVSDVSDIQFHFRRAVQRGCALANTADPDRRDSVDCFPLRTFQDPAMKIASDAVLDWGSVSNLKIEARPADQHIQLSPTNTYWLVGLTGGIGISLCRWMIDRGARNVVLSSRCPTVDPGWLEDMKLLGAVVRICPCDVTNVESLKAAYDEITTTLPPIAGVAHGAMVLQDTSNHQMSVEALAKVTKPKVEGSIHLNDLFQGQSKDLEFFVFLSSATAINGNVGQTNYTAANMFMASLAEHRRRRGLAASIIDIGPIFDIGYIAQASQQDDERMVFTQATMRSGGFMPTSKDDLHQLFAEALIAGRLGSSGPSQISTGLRKIDPNHPDQPVWASEPLMSHFVLSRGWQTQPRADAQVTVPLKAQLVEPASWDDIHGIIQNAVHAKVRDLFQIAIERTTDHELASMSFDEIGVDSLSAVEIRRWFMKSLEVNIPVLKILNELTIGELVTLAVESLPPILIPNMVSEAFSDIESRLTKTEDSASMRGDSDGQPQSVAESSSTEPHLDIDTTAVETSLTKPISDGILPCLGYSEHLEVEQPLAPVIRKSSRLSFSQDMMWFFWDFLSDKTSLNHTGWARITGKMQVEALRTSIETVTQKHEALRTCFFLKEYIPMQGIMDTSPLKLEVRGAHAGEDVEESSREMRNYVLDIARGETMRLVLVRRSPTEHFLVYGVHSLAMDGYSFQLFLEELQASMNHRPTRHASQFTVYSERQHKDLMNGRWSSQLHYWRTEYATLPPTLPILNISASSLRPPLDAFENERAVLRLPMDTKAQVQAACRRLRCTPFHFYLATLRALLSRLSSDADDVVIGIGDANRPDEDMMDVLGAFMNILPIRLQTQSSQSFESLLKHVRDKTYDALGNSRIPFQVLLRELKVPRSATNTSLFQCLVNYRLGQSETMTWRDAQVRFEGFEFSKLPYVIALDIIDVPDRECVHILQVQKELYGLSGAERLIQSYEKLPKAFVSHPGLDLDEPDLFGDDESRIALELSKGPIQSSLWPETVIHRVFEVADLSPLSPAILSETGNTTSYLELTRHASSVAAALLTAGIGPNDPVAVLQEATNYWISSVIGIMQLAAVYVPLDQGMPWSRLATMVDDCGTRTVLVDGLTKKNVGKLQRPGIIVIDASNVEVSSGTIPIAARANHTAAILYTSGSSGTPKGIMSKHQGIRNFIEPITQLYEVGSNEVVLQQTSSAFDMSLSQIFKALCSGWGLCILPRHDRHDAVAICRIMRHHGVTVTVATPSEYTAWLSHGREDLRHCEDWKLAFCGGEPIPQSLLRLFTSAGSGRLEVYNHYGPTETSFAVASTRVHLDDHGVMDGSGHIAAGRPLPNCSIYLLDERMRPVPTGMQGEIYIGGAGVGLGYVNMPELTREKFVPNPFTSAEDAARGWTTLHRTGDLGRWGEDGLLLVHGRDLMDSQVKLRGLRVDLREVEQVIASGREIRQAAVSLRQASFESPSVLVAHVVIDEQHSIDKVDPNRLVSTVLSRADNLPRYMWPASVLPVNSLPLTNSGKLDRRAIARLPLTMDVETDHLPIRGRLTVVEERLKEIWETVVPRILEERKGFIITPETDFFHIGGTSVLLLGLRARVHETFGVELPLLALFGNSTLSAMAQIIGLSPSLIEVGESMITGPDIRNSNGKVVVLTGATGLLGRGLLGALLDDPNVKQVHCLAVRNRASILDLQGVERLSVHNGDLGLPRLGLSEEDAASIFREADLVIHSGADVSYLKTYKSLRKCNVGSTMELAELCLGRIIPFHYISTASIEYIVAEHLVAPGSAQASEMNAAASLEGQGSQRRPFGFGPESAAPYPPNLPVSEGGSATVGHARGYVASKWASERFLERVKERFPSWPVSIHRPGIIIPERAAEGMTPGLGIVQNVSKYSALLRAMPSITNSYMGVSIELVPLNTVVGKILESSKTNKEEAVASSPRYLHHDKGD
ncbi:Hybrid PKS-NRPS biosynthetic cluster [Apiospora aurea]|uniref:Hybrid PKS-NRPS biosynthetic cluster n=1 Tax=Apiospora aurea TaxID=335848 RepID=A0ABR1QQ39_9PEZI